MHDRRTEILLRKDSEPKEINSDVQIPFSNKRARIIDKIRKRVAGAAADYIRRQQGTELKLTTRRNILHKAGCDGKHFVIKEGNPNKGQTFTDLEKTP